MNGLALCAGVGGLELGLKLALGEGYRTVCYVEREAFAASTLVARMDDEALDTAPIWDDLTTFDGKPWRGLVDVVSAGFPCQPFSTAGKRQGLSDERWIWPDIARILREVGPGVVFLENVPGLVRHGLAAVLGDLAESGFDAEWGVFSARGVGAPHLRKRVFILAYSRRIGQEVGQEQAAGGQQYSEELAHRPSLGCLGHEADSPEGCEPDASRAGVVADGSGARHEQEGSRKPGQSSGGSILSSDGRCALADAEQSDLLEAPPGGAREARGVATASASPWPPGPNDRDAWTRVLAQVPTLEPALCGVAHGVPHRMDRLRALGNGVVPLAAAHAFHTLYHRLED